MRTSVATITLAVAVCLPAGPARSQEPGPKPGEATEADFHGKVVAIAVKSPARGGLLENVRIRRLGGRTFLVGKFAKQAEDEDYPDSTAWFPIEDVVYMAVFKNVADARKASELQRTHQKETRADPPAKDGTARLLKDLGDPGPFVRGAAIDQLGRRKVVAAVPRLIDLLADGTALPGSDNWVGGHAAGALQAITGRPFSTDQGEWRRWWKEHARDFRGK